MIAFLPIIAFMRARLGRSRERGASAVEYAIMVGFIAAVVVFGVTALGHRTNQNFTSAAAVGVH